MAKILSKLQQKSRMGPGHCIKPAQIIMWIGRVLHLDFRNVGISIILLYNQCLLSNAQFTLKKVENLGWPWTLHGIASNIILDMPTRVIRVPESEYPLG
jgi:hypothetical protein